MAAAASAVVAAAAAVVAAAVAVAAAAVAAVAAAVAAVVAAAVAVVAAVVAGVTVAAFNAFRRGGVHPAAAAAAAAAAASRVYVQCSPRYYLVDFAYGYTSELSASTIESLSARLSSET